LPAGAVLRGRSNDEDLVAALKEAEIVADDPAAAPLQAQAPSGCAGLRGASEEIIADVKDWRNGVFTRRRRVLRGFLDVSSSARETA
jgi:hypothetical protein